MQEIINSLIEEVNRYRGLVAITDVEPFKSDYQRKAYLLEQAVETLKKVDA